jgi:ATP-GRASP peptide maturase of grasp-with-spasm system
MDWLEHSGAEFIRLNGEDLEHSLVRVTIKDGNSSIGLHCDDRQVPLEKVRVVWYRRWLPQSMHEVTISEFDDMVAKSLSEGASSEIGRHLRAEQKKLSAFIFSSLSHANWLTTPNKVEVNKLRVLEAAAHVGLDTPSTLITTSKSDAIEFFLHHEAMITKSISDSPILFAKDKAYMLFTAEIGRNDLKDLPESFFPSLFQEKLSKEYEVRIFYLAGEFFPMAIFSQLDRQTSADFRNYNHAKPNRCVPYSLSSEVTRKLELLMLELSLETGSIDMVKTTDGRLVFLEVNPVGQFGMVSKPCNYFLEKRVAELLVQKGYPEQKEG